MWFGVLRWRFKLFRFYCHPVPDAYTIFNSYDANAFDIDSQAFGFDEQSALLAAAAYAAAGIANNYLFNIIMFSIIAKVVHFIALVSFVFPFCEHGGWHRRVYIGMHSFRHLGSFDCFYMLRFAFVASIFTGKKVEICFYCSATLAFVSLVLCVRVRECLET